MLHPLPAFSDNYIWALHDGKTAWVVDPGDAQPVLDWLDANSLCLQGILITHHHADHTGGVTALQQATGAVAYGPAGESLPEGVQRLSEGDTLNVLHGDCQVLEVPGHTVGHIAFFWQAQTGEKVLFCGDTLFSGGCGRLFEGTPAQMLRSLDQLATLPADTQVCCAHEYTLSNLRFALTVEPSNPDLQRYQTWCQAQRTQSLPTLPSNLALERSINPFLRSREPSVLKAIRQQDAHALDDETAFAALRRWKDGFRG